MDLVSGYKGVVERIFRNENSASDDDSYVERLLDRISNGTLPEDRRTAMLELHSVVAESRAAQLAFGAMGLPVISGVLKDERDDIEMVRGALETLLSALTPIDNANMPKNEVIPASFNADLLSQEVGSISILLSLLSEEDFYVRYYTLQLLTALLSKSLNRLQETILTIPRGITQLMDMLMDREVIRNEALLLLTYLTREAEEIQKIVVFEGAFEKIFSIIQEEGSSEGGMVVQDCLELLNNILRNNVSNQILLKETIGFDPLLFILKLRGHSYKFTQQKTINLLNAIETLNLLLMGTSDADPSKDANDITAKTVLVQKKVLDHLLVLAVESPWAPVAVRCAALQCIGDLINGHPKNRDVFASKKLGEEPQIEPAINSILRIILRTSSVQEFIAADYVIKCFCEKNVDGQVMLASTLIPQPHSMTDAPIEDMNMSFGSMLLHGLTMSEHDGDLETCSRTAAVLSHVLKDNLQCKERFSQIEVEVPMGSFKTSEPLMHRMVKYLALSSSLKNIDGRSNSSGNLYNQPIILQLLIIWLASCPSAVSCFLCSRTHLTYLLELVSNEAATECIGGLAAVLLGECVLYNNSNDSGKDAFAIVDAISQKVGLTAFLLKLEEMQKSFLFTSATPSQPHKTMMRSPAASTEEIVDVDEKYSSSTEKEHHLILSSMFDSHFVDFVNSLGTNIRDSILEVYSKANNEVTVVPAELERKPGESDGTYIIRLKSFMEKQYLEIQNLLSRNATLAEKVASVAVTERSETELLQASGVTERVQMETLKRNLQEATQRVEMLRTEKAKIESESHSFQIVIGKLESDLRSLSDAYNSLKQANFHLEKEMGVLKSGGSITPDIEAIKEEAREEAQKESEAELSDLLVCLGQEQSKIKRLCARLLELGVDVDELLEGIGDEVIMPEDSEEDEAYLIFDLLYLRWCIGYFSLYI